MIYRLGDVPAEQTLGISEQILQQKNEGIQILAGVAVNIEDGAALPGGICHSLETVLLLPDQGDGLAEAVFGDPNRLLGRSVALPLLFPILTVLHQEVVEVAGVGSIEFLITQIEFLVIGLIQPPVQQLVGVLEGLLEYKADGIVIEAFRADEQQVGADGVCQIHHPTELGIVFVDEVHCNNKGAFSDHNDDPFCNEMLRGLLGRPRKWKRMGQVLPVVIQLAGPSHPLWDSAPAPQGDNGDLGADW